jgi:Uma2 family endonuclease
VFVELSLDASACGLDLSKFGIKNKDELKPDVCVYLKTSAPKSEGDGEKRLDSDIIRVPKPPALVIEVLSPSQSVNELLRKLDAYFAMGVQSAWLVIPSLEEIKVFSPEKNRKNFEVGTDEEVIDETLDIRLPIKKIFERFTPF